MTQVLSSAVEAIGRTPLGGLDRLTGELGLEGTILAELDHLNPGLF